MPKRQMQDLKFPKEVYPGSRDDILELYHKRATKWYEANYAFPYSRLYAQFNKVKNHLRHPCYWSTMNEEMNQIAIFNYKTRGNVAKWQAADDWQDDWTDLTEPDVLRDDIYALWGRKTFGEDWYQLREEMLEEGRYVAYFDTDSTAEAKQVVLRQMESRTKLQIRGKTWDELLEWAEAHYGTEWKVLRQRRASAILEEKMEQVGQIELEIRSLQIQKDQDALRQGCSWHHIMILESSQSGPELSSAEALALAKQGPPEIQPSYFLNAHMSVTERRERLEWETVTLQRSKEDYESGQCQVLNVIRTMREKSESMRREDAEINAARHLMQYDCVNWENEMQRVAARSEEFVKVGDSWTKDQFRAARAADMDMLDWHLANRDPMYETHYMSCRKATEAEQKAYPIWIKAKDEAKLRIYGSLPPPLNDPWPSLGHILVLKGNAYDAWRKGILGRVGIRQREGRKRYEFRGTRRSRRFAKFTIEYNPRDDPESILRRTNQKVQKRKSS